MVEKNQVQQLEEILRNKDINIWRLADSDEWSTMREKNLLSFNWLDPEINYSKIDLDNLDRGKWSIRPWVKELSVGDIIFVMNKNSYCGIAKAKTTYNHDGPHVAIGTTKIKPAIEVEYLHEVEEPVPHNISTHNNPRTFADIDKYNFGLDNVLEFLQQELPEAIEALEKYVINEHGDNRKQAVQQLKQFEKEENVLLFAEIVRELYDDLNEPKASPRIALTVPQNRNRFSLNLNNRHYLGLRNHNGEDEFLITLDRPDYENLLEDKEYKNKLRLLPDDRSTFAEKNDLVDAIIVVISADFLKEKQKLFTDFWLRSAYRYHDAMERSPYKKYHNSFLQYLIFDEDRLHYYWENSDQIDSIDKVAKRLLSSIGEVFPNFKGFTDPRFIEEEITYKQRIIRDAQEQLSSENMRELWQQQKDFKEIYDRILGIGRHKDNNLLYKGTPRTGDLAILHDPNLDVESFADAILHLVTHHGVEMGNEKIDLFCDWAEEQGLPNKWTFATYYLFVTNPEEELFIKPTEGKQFLEMLGKGDLWHHRPTGELYKTIKDDLQAVGEALPFEVNRGFLDLQSFLWSALAADDDKFEKSKKYLKQFSEVADKHFSQKSDFLVPRYQFFQDFFKRENLEQAEWSDFQEMGEKVHALATNALALKRAFGDPNHAIERYRKSFIYLAYGEDSLAERINNILDKESEYHLKYLAESFYGELVGYLYPEKYVFYNRRDKEATAFLKLDVSRERGESFGDFFVRYNEEIASLVGLYEEIVGQRTETTVPLELDQFFSWLYENHVSEEPEIDDELKPDQEARNYWWLNANPDIWQYSERDIGEEQSYYSHNDDGNKRRIYQYFQEVQPGDLIIGYESRSVKRVKAILEVTEALFTDDEDREKFSFAIKKFTPNQPGWNQLKSIPELENCSVLNNNQGSLFKLTEDEFWTIHDLAFNGIEPYDSYSMDDALEEVFIKEDQLQNILDLLEYKKNIILQGPPGTGKTFLAKRLAWLMSGIKDPNRIEVVQFHQSYSYEDFIRGYRPTKDHFELKDGIFMQLCKRAKSDPENKPYFLVIDEINRGNLSKIFGELMMLIEKDKRGKDFTVKLPYRNDEDEPDFYIPKNLHLIGTMNTADRSLAMVDYALRRRFVFIDMMPNFGDKFQAHLKDKGIDDHMIDTIVERMAELNKKISDKQELGPGPGYQIGHSYFCGTEDGDEDWYKNIVRFEIIPLLKEYWFDKPTKVEEVEEQLLTI
ncbi:AAA family ATPase [Halalkalibaculum sp. DA3122]|uniref:AAA family ATPase n=1 Tax=Halalkalibaculum sp. DA3122 TaxID=3373607 RepID=UPI003754B42A